MSRIWGGKGTERKDECIQRILQGVAKESSVRTMLSRLRPEEYAALILLKACNGFARVGTIEAAVLASGLPVEQDDDRHSYGYYDRNESRFGAALIRRGIALPVCPPGVRDYYFGSFSREISRDAFLYADERILRQVEGRFKVRSLALTPAETPTSGWVGRRPQHVQLDLLAMIRACREMKPLSLTKAGTIRAADERQLQRSLNWQDAISQGGKAFPDFGGALMQVGIRLGLIRIEGSSHSAQSHEGLSRLALAEQVRYVLDCLLDISPEIRWHGEDESLYSRGNLHSLCSAIIFGLRAAPDAARAYELENFTAALYERIGQTFQSRFEYDAGRPNRYDLRTSPGDFQAALDAWKVKHRKRWIEREKKFVRGMLTTWLYWLGMVEVGEIGPDRTVFRITELGRRVFGEADDSIASPRAVEGEKPAWVVQPNYDIVVFLDAVTPEQLTFLERHAERRQTEAHTAHYLLTNESVLHGLENGGSVEEVLGTLRLGAQAELPQNVQREIREWACQRERLTVHTGARLIAFPTSEERTRLMQAGLQGRPVGETFLLVDAARPLIEHRIPFGREPLHIVEYSQPRRKTLRADEDGTILLLAKADDLLLDGQLAACAEPVDERTWRLTPSSLTKARAAGETAQTLLTFLESRLLAPIPPLLECCIRNALGSRTTVQAGPVLAVRIADKNLYSALTTSPLARSYILDVPGPDMILVAEEHRGKFVSLLETLNIRLAPVERSEERPDWRQTVRDARTQQRRRKRY